MFKQIKEYITDNAISRREANLYFVLKLKTENAADYISPMDLIKLLELIQKLK